MKIEKKQKNKYSLTFIYLNIYLAILILLPKNFSNLFDIIPIRTALAYLLFIIFLYDKKKNNLKLNNFNFKWIGIPYVLFLIFTIPSFLISKNIIVSLYTLIKFLSFILILYVYTKTKINKEGYIIIIKNILICTGIKIIYGILEYIFEINLFTTGRYKYPGSKGRIASQFFNTIYYGIFINIIFSYILYFFHKTDNKKYKLILGIILFITYINLLLTFTRSSFLVFCGIIVLILIILNKQIIDRFTISLGLICICASFIIPGVNSFAFSAVNDAISLFGNFNVLQQFLPGIYEDEKTEDIDDKTFDKDGKTFEDYSLEHRKEFSKLANNIARDNMYTGVGFGTYINYLNDSEFDTKYSYYTLSKTHPHSSFVLMFAEVSVIALIFFTLFIISLAIYSVKNMVNNYKKDEIRFSIASINLIVLIGFFIVNLIAENAFYDTQIFPIFLIIIAFGLSFTYKEKNEIK